MAECLSASKKRGMISSFLEITACQTNETARQFLQATNWQLEDAIQLFYAESNNKGSDDFGNLTNQGSEDLDDWNGQGSDDQNDQCSEDVCELNVRSSEDLGQWNDQGNYEDHWDAANDYDNYDWTNQSSGDWDNVVNDKDSVNNWDNQDSEALDNRTNIDSEDLGDGVRAPLPVVRKTLYEDDEFNFDDEVKHSTVWESNSQDQLASLYQPPFHLMFYGSFEKAKCTSADQNKWLIVNLQSTKEFNSHLLNRDTWGNDAVGQIISTNFIFWQVNDDTTNGQKVSTYYKLSSFPAVLVIDPITGQKMRSWSGMILAESFLEDIISFIDRCPMDHLASIKQKPIENSPPTKELKVFNEADKETLLVEEATPITEKLGVFYPLLTEEPKVDRNLLCRVGIRLPDGRRVQRSFLRTDPIQLLWSLSDLQLGEIERKAFKLAQAIPGATKYLDYDSKLTFGESGFANSMISIILD
ncbi:hypothetical protein ACFE04_030786 [Oxalis oulophora]